MFHPSTEFSENPLNSFCLIVLTNENVTSLATVITYIAVNYFLVDFFFGLPVVSVLDSTKSRSQTSCNQKKRERERERQRVR